jgi:hypothetical protein
VVNRYWDYFPYLLNNLSWDDETLHVELSDRILGFVSVEKTFRVRMTHGNKNVVCAIIGKDAFTPENLLLSSVLLGVNILSNRYREEGKAGLIDHFTAMHEESLTRITDYSALLLKDRLAGRLLNYYLSNHEGIEALLRKIGQRLNGGKLVDKYYPLLQFVKESKASNWKLSEHLNNLRRALSAYFDNISEERLYEMWIFFRILGLLSPVTQIGDKVFATDGGDFSVEYQKGAGIGWTSKKYDIDEKEIAAINVKRVPDITISKRGKDKMVVDAKCMDYSDIEDDKQEPGPERNIANQMIIYLDYVTSSELAVVLFADPKIRGDVSLGKGNRRIIFLNCYPFSTSLTAFERVKQYLSE